MPIVEHLAQIIYPSNQELSFVLTMIGRGSPMDKKTVAGILREIGIFLELKGENPFKSRAYHNASRIIETLDMNLEQTVKENKIDQVKGIGKGLAEKITELVLTGNLEYYDELKSSIPQGLIQLMDIQGLGPKKIKLLHDKMGITTPGELEYACLENRLVSLPGFGQKSQANILKGINYLKKYRSRFLYPLAWENAVTIREYLESEKSIQNIKITGSLRRKMETVKDIDILVSANNPPAVVDMFTSYPGIETVIARGETKTSVKLDSGINVDLRIVEHDQFPFALHHFTGSKTHNTAMRSRAKKLGYKMNEYGLFKESGSIPCSSEKEIFHELKLAYIPAELRENMGEIEAAEKDLIPQLVTETDVKGVFHIHTVYSDGANTIEELVNAARKHQWRYIGIADHSKTAYYAGGLTEDQVKNQHKEIDRLNELHKDLRIFKGIESDILPSGDLDYPDSVLESFDFVIVSIHSNFNMPRNDMTNRIVTALRNPYTTMLGHPTGRLLLSREAYELDMDKILSTAAENNVMVEINSHPYRLDLDWRELKKAKEKGIMLSINPDAHDVTGLDDYLYGIGIARKGWLTKTDILNCMDTSTVMDIFTRRKF